MFVALSILAEEQAGFRVSDASKSVKSLGTVIPLDRLLTGGVGPRSEEVSQGAFPPRKWLKI